MQAASETPNDAVAGLKTVYHYNMNTKALKSAWWHTLILACSSG